MSAPRAKKRHAAPKAERIVPSQSSHGCLRWFLPSVFRPRMCANGRCSVESWLEAGRRIQSESKIATLLAGGSGWGPVATRTMVARLNPIRTGTTVRLKPWGGGDVSETCEGSGVMTVTIAGRFLAEGVLLSALGGLAGTVIGAVATVIYAVSQHWSVQIPPRPSTAVSGPPSSSALSPDCTRRCGPPASHQPKRCTRYKHPNQATQP